MAKIIVRTQTEPHRGKRAATKEFLSPLAIFHRAGTGRVCVGKECPCVAIPAYLKLASMAAPAI